MRALEGTAWVVEYPPEIWSYLDRPKMLSELRMPSATEVPVIKSITLANNTMGSTHPASNARLFGNWLESRENLMRVPNGSI